MGLKDTPMMSAVPAHDVMRSRDHSARSGTSSRDQASAGTAAAAAALEESLLALTLKDSSLQEQDDVSFNSEVDDMEYQHELMGAGVGDCGVYDDDDLADEDWEPDESRLSRALRSWMSSYVITPLPPQAHAVHEPVFSARLGNEQAIRRAPSTESINTQLSLFSCSSHGSRKRKDRKRRRVRRKKTPSSSADPGVREKPQSAGQGSRWVELSRRRKGELDRFMMAQSHALTQGVNLMEESEAFQMCEADEQRALYECGQQNKMAFAAELKKSDSMTNIKEALRGKRRQRVASASAKTFHGKPLDFQELHRQLQNQKLAALTLTSSGAAPRRASSRRSLHRTHSRLSLSSVGSSGGDNNSVFFSATGTGSGGGGGGGADTSPPSSLRGPPASRCSSGEGEPPPHPQPPRPAAVPPPKEKSVNMWKGDAQILAIDLNRELTSKVKRRIAVTTTALERVTGLGDDNEQRPYTCHLPEFPAHVDEDFAHQPRIPQKIRIAPHLSDVIKSDIKIRMGRPRYHEIRTQDLEAWNRGFQLDRTHRNLKVFNWLHSLQEEEFDEAVLRQTIRDVPPEEDEVSFGDMVLIRAADEPEVKPLYEQKRTYVR